jgi:serine/threonine-protein kinase
MNRFDEAIKQMQQALELDPRSLQISADAGYVFSAAGESDRAIDILQKALEMDPNYGYAHFWLGHVYLVELKASEAMAEYEKARNLSAGWGPSMEFGVGVAYGLMGRTEKAREALDSMLKRAEGEYYSPYFIAMLHFFLGERDEGFLWLEKGIEKRDFFMAGLKAKPLPDFLDLHSDPRFQAILKKMNLEK